MDGNIGQARLVKLEYLHLSSKQSMLYQYDLHPFGNVGKQTYVLFDKLARIRSWRNGGPQVPPCDLNNLNRPTANSR